MNYRTEKHVPVFILFSELVVLEFLLLREGAPLGRQLLTELAEGDLRVLAPHTLTPLVKEMHISAQRLFRGSCSLTLKRKVIISSGLLPLDNVYLRVASFAFWPSPILGLSGLVI